MKHVVRTILVLQTLVAIVSATLLHARAASTIPGVIVYTSGTAVHLINPGRHE